MTLLKEDIERINNLPIEEYMKVVGDMTQEEYKEFFSKQPLNEGNEPFKPILVDYTLEEDIEKNGTVLAEDLINNLKKRHDKKA